jgi:hypothetical protein
VFQKGKGWWWSLGVWRLNGREGCHCSAWSQHEDKANDGNQSDEVAEFLITYVGAPQAGVEPGEIGSGSTVLQSNPISDPI